MLVLPNDRRQWRLDSRPTVWSRRERDYTIIVLRCKALELTPHLTGHSGQVSTVQSRGGLLADGNNHVNCKFGDAFLNELEPSAGRTRVMPSLFHDTQSVAILIMHVPDIGGLFSLLLHGLDQSRPPHTFAQPRSYLF